ncbi:MAG: hypothetical protein JHC26_01920 [Thermofilum sp.]|jgi:transcription termination factor NusB|uniref:hypothetical protein n=1 Tax=Thermofilum sp. TaxID=1961369 RepID=UPI0025896606|nr:hypothetical protein [Thermofilum sp.]MCI4407820.1 hypothetical protein [Thermofilum sp.]
MSAEIEQNQVEMKEENQEEPREPKKIDEKILKKLVEEILENPERYQNEAKLLLVLENCGKLELVEGEILEVTLEQSEGNRRTAIVPLSLPVVIEEKSTGTEPKSSIVYVFTVEGWKSVHVN